MSHTNSRNFRCQSANWKRFRKFLKGKDSDHVLLGATDFLELCSGVCTVGEGRGGEGRGGKGRGGEGREGEGRGVGLALDRLV